MTVALRLGDLAAYAPPNALVAAAVAWAAVAWAAVA
jgi:hypothetical protein